MTKMTKGTDTKKSSSKSKRLSNTTGSSSSLASRRKSEKQQEEEESASETVIIPPEPERRSRRLEGQPKRVYDVNVMLKAQFSYEWQDVSRTCIRCRRHKTFDNFEKKRRTCIQCTKEQQELDDELYDWTPEIVPEITQKILQKSNFTVEEATSLVDRLDATYWDSVTLSDRRMERDGIIFFRDKKDPTPGTAFKCTLCAEPIPLSDLTTHVRSSHTDRVYHPRQSRLIEEFLSGNRVLLEPSKRILKAEIRKEREELRENQLAMEAEEIARAQAEIPLTDLEIERLRRIERNKLMMAQMLGAPLKEEEDEEHTAQEKPKPHQGGQGGDMVQ